MAAESVYPVGGDPLVAGEPWAVVVLLQDEVEPVTVPSTFEDRDLTGTFWRCQVRRTPLAPLVATFAIDPPSVPDGGTVPNQLVMRLTATQTAVVLNGMWFELEELSVEDGPDVDADVVQSFWRAKLRVVTGVTHD